MNRKERRSNERRLKKNKNSKSSLTKPVRVGEDQFDSGTDQANFNKWVRDSSYSDVFWRFTETQIVESYERTNPGKHIEAPIERHSHDGFYFPFVEGLNPEDIIGLKIEGDLTKKWLFIALLTHCHVGAFSFENGIENHLNESTDKIKAIGAYTKF